MGSVVALGMVRYGEKPFFPAAQSDFACFFAIWTCPDTEAQRKSVQRHFARLRQWKTYSWQSFRKRSLLMGL